MKESETVRLKGMKQALSEKVIAQDRAIKRLTRAITRNRLGLKDPNRPDWYVYVCRSHRRG